MITDLIEVIGGFLIFFGVGAVIVTWTWIVLSN